MARPLGVILAGGLSRRMGREKALLPLAGRPLLGHVIDRLAPQVDGLLLNANGDPARLAGFGLPVVADGIPGHPGPLAGVLAGLDWAAQHRPGCRHVLTVPVDCPFLPPDLAARLAAAAGPGVAVAASGGRRHPVIALWPVALAAELRRAIETEGLRKVELWLDRHAPVTVAFDGDPDPFLNVNDPAGLVAAEAALARAARPAADS